jgi:hypothetical protein
MNPSRAFTTPEYWIHYEEFEDYLFKFYELSKKEQGEIIRNMKQERDEREKDY